MSKKRNNVVPPNLTIDDIINIIKPLEPLTDNTQIIYNESTIAAQCASKHIHKYFISDIVLTPPKCITCSRTTKRAEVIRKVAEGFLKIPFALVNGSRSAFINPAAKVMIKCVDNATSYEVVDGITEIYMKYSTDKELIKNHLRRALHCGDLTDRIYKKKLSFCAQMSLPQAQEVAEMTAQHIGYNTLAAQLDPNIIFDSKQLCLENCVESIDPAKLKTPRGYFSN